MIPRGARGSKEPGPHRCVARRSEHAGAARDDDSNGDGGDEIAHRALVQERLLEERLAQAIEDLGRYAAAEEDCLPSP